MDAILRILSDPSAWVTNIIFGLATSLVWKLFPFSKNKIIGSFRSSRLKRIRKLRQMRTNQAAVTMAIGKATAMHAAFLILCFMYVFAMFLSDSYRAVISRSLLEGIILASPILIFELVWLSYDSFANALVKECSKLSRLKR